MNTWRSKAPSKLVPDSLWIFKWECSSHSCMEYCIDKDQELMPRLQHPSLRLTLETWVHPASLPPHFSAYLHGWKGQNIAFGKIIVFSLGPLALPCAFSVLRTPYQGFLVSQAPGGCPSISCSGSVAFPGRRQELPQCHRDPGGLRREEEARDCCLYSHKTQGSWDLRSLDLGLLAKQMEYGDIYLESS